MLRLLVLDTNLTRIPRLRRDRLLLLLLLRLYLTWWCLLLLWRIKLRLRNMVVLSWK